MSSINRYINNLLAEHVQETIEHERLTAAALRAFESAALSAIKTLPRKDIATQAQTQHAMLVRLNEKMHIKKNVLLSLHHDVEATDFENLSILVQTKISNAWSEIDKAAFAKTCRKIVEFGKKMDDAQAEDSALHMIHITAPSTCPLTQCELVQPVVNTECGHVYSKTAIEEYVRNGPRSCPVLYCSRVVKREFLKNDCKF